MRPIPGYPGYVASGSGTILSSRHGTALRVHLHKGYGHVRIYAQGRKRLLPVHQLVLHAFKGPRPSSAHVARHLNGRATDNRASNLVWGTASDNACDSMRHGTAVCLRRGDESIRSRLSSWQVLEIERRARTGEPQARIAAEFGVTQVHVSYIKLHKTWCHLWAMTARPSQPGAVVGGQNLGNPLMPGPRSAVHAATDEFSEGRGTPRAGGHHG